jgi:hypothetical protein
MKLINNIKILFIFSFLLLAGCSDPAQTRFENQYAHAKNSLTTLDNNFSALTNHVSSATTRGKYERTMILGLEQLKKEYPDSVEVDSMISQFRLDTTKDGSVYRKIKADFDIVKNNPKYSVMKSSNGKSHEYKTFGYTYFNAINAANQTVQLSIFDDHFIDYINTIASLSKTIQPVVVDKSSLKGTAVGNQFVGNPAYGSWKTNPSTGHQHWSFLETYAFLMIMDNSFSGGRYYSDRGYGSGYRGGYRSSYRYDSWRTQRSWSYNNDTYMKNYATPNTRSKYTSSLSKVNKNSNYKGKTYSNKVINKQSAKISKSKYSSNLTAKNSSIKNKSKSNYNSNSNSNSNSNRNKSKTSSTKSKYSSNLVKSSSPSRSKSRGK